MDANPAMRGWGRVDAPAPDIGIYAARTDLLREANPRRWWSNYLSLFTNQQGAPGLPDGQMTQSPIGNTQDQGTFLMQNVRRYSPNGSLKQGNPGATGTIGAGDMQNSMGSQNAQAPGGQVIPVQFGFGVA